jgi:hypothetical protein
LYKFKHWSIIFNSFFLSLDSFLLIDGGWWMVNYECWMVDEGME